MDECIFEAYSEVEQSHWWLVARREILLAVLARHLPEGASLLDIGCGTGFFLERARERYTVGGLDLSESAVAQCHRRGLDTIRVGTVDDLAAEAGNRYDAVSLLDVIEHLDDDVGALRNAGKLLSEGGLLLVSVPAFRFLWSELDDMNHHKRRYRAGELRRAIESAGFDIVKLSYFNSLLFPAIAAARIAQRLLRRRSGVSDYQYKSGLLNSLLRGIFAAERHWLVRGNFPAGVSLLAVARKRISAC